MDRRAFIGALGLGALWSAACTRPAIVHADDTRDGISYSARGGYNALDFATLVAQYGGGFQGSAELPNTMPSGTPTPAPRNFTGYRLGKVGKRWVFVDPLGKVMLLRGLYKVSYDQVHQISDGQQAGRYDAPCLSATGGEPPDNEEQAVVAFRTGLPAWRPGQ